MKRGKKLLMNLSIIMLILLVEYYLGGYYFSKEECIKDTLRGLYSYETENIMEFKKGNRTITLMANLDAKSYSIVCVKKNGILYHIDDSFTGHPIEEDNSFAVLGGYDDLPQFLCGNLYQRCRIGGLHRMGNPGFPGLRLFCWLPDQLSAGVYGAGTGKNQPGYGAAS